MVGPNTITCHCISLKCTFNEELKYYWDPSHYKEILGDMILDRVLGAEKTDKTVQDNFGILLNTENINSVLENIRARQKAYRLRNPQDVAMIKKWVEEFKKEHGIID